MAVTVAERMRTAAGVGGHVERLEDVHRIAGDGSRRSLKLSPSRFGGKAFGFAKIHRTDFSEEVLRGLYWKGAPYAFSLVTRLENERITRYESMEPKRAKVLTPQNFVICYASRKRPAAFPNVTL